MRAWVVEDEQACCTTPATRENGGSMSVASVYRAFCQHVSRQRQFTLVRFCPPSPTDLLFPVHTCINQGKKVVFTEPRAFHGLARLGFLPRLPASLSRIVYLPGYTLALLSGSLRRLPRPGIRERESNLIATALVATASCKRGRYGPLDGGKSVWPLKLV